MEPLHIPHFCCILLLTFIQNKHCYFVEKSIFNKKKRTHAQKKGSSNFGLHSITKVQLQFAINLLSILNFGASAAQDIYPDCYLHRPSSSIPATG